MDTDQPLGEGRGPGSVGGGDVCLQNHSVASIRTNISSERVLLIHHRVREPFAARSQSWHFFIVEVYVAN